ncbi:hypothetical protein DXZ75_05735 [Streptomyces sp. AcE210]|nr:hypothetical protein DXZ75_05735 [Streptomyces sp. AcE210]
MNEIRPTTIRRASIGQLDPAATTSAVPMAGTNPATTAEACEAMPRAEYRTRAPKGSAKKVPWTEFMPTAPPSVASAIAVQAARGVKWESTSQNQGKAGSPWTSS